MIYLLLLLNNWLKLYKFCLIFFSSRFLIDFEIITSLFINLNNQQTIKIIFLTNHREKQQQQQKIRERKEFSKIGK